MPLASINGKILPVEDATVAVTDEGLIRGDGAFEMVSIHRGKPFTLSEHLDRLQCSCDALGLECPREQLESEAATLLESAEFGDGALRVVLTRGGNRILLLEKVEPHLEAIRLMTVTYSPNVVLDGVKSLSYAANMAATRRAKEEGFDEALLVTPDGYVLEAPTATIFWADADGVLKTPALELGILASITRDILIKAHENVVEGSFTLDDILAAGEAFLASTTRDVQPVAAINGTEIAHPGPVTTRAKDHIEAARQAAP